MENVVYIVYRQNPYISSFPHTHLFFDKQDAICHILNEITDLLEDQKSTVSGLKGDKKKHIDNYRHFLIENDMLYFYGEYIDYYNTMEPYELQYKIECKYIE